MKQREPQVIGLGAEQRYDRRTQVDNQEGKTNGIEGDFIKTKNAKNRHNITTSGSQQHSKSRWNIHKQTQ